MKRTLHILKLSLLLLVFTGFGTAGFAQGADAAFTKINAAIQSNDAAALAAHFNTTVELTIPGHDADFSSKQALFLMKDFFAKYPGKTYRTVHTGQSGSTHYSTGTFISGKGTFDTNVFVKRVGDKFVITQIRFETED